MKCQICDLQMVPHVYHVKYCGEYTLYSQLGQDLIVADFYKEKKGGFFVEIGAVDGIEISICLKPSGREFALKLYHEKLVKNRPNSK